VSFEKRRPHSRPGGFGSQSGGFGNQGGGGQRRPYGGGGGGYGGGGGGFGGGRGGGYGGGGGGGNRAFQSPNRRPAPPPRRNKPKGPPPRVRVPATSAERRAMLKAAAWRMSKIVHCQPKALIAAPDPMTFIKVPDARARELAKKIIRLKKTTAAGK
jgi:hypothetical protein